MFKKLRNTRIKDNFAGSRQSNLKNQARKHRLQGAMILLIVIIASAIPAVIYGFPLLKETIETRLLKAQEDNKVAAILSSQALGVRDKLDAYKVLRISKEILPEDALVMADLNEDLILKRSVEANVILTKGDIMLIGDLVPDLQRYEEYSGIITIPSGLSSGSEDESNMETIVVDVRYRDRQAKRDEVILSKKEIPLIIGNTLWLRLENERERVLMNAAIQEKNSLAEESFAEITLSIYTEPTLQEPAQVTYLLKEERLKLEAEINEVTKDEQQDN